jgi:integrase
MADSQAPFWSTRSSSAESMRPSPPGALVRLPLARSVPAHPPATVEPAAPRLLDRVRQAIAALHYSPRTERSYVAWIKRYIFFHGKRHPTEMGAPEVRRFLASLATTGKVSASTQNQAFSALLFLYREVLHREISGLETVERAKRPVHVPLVLSHEEVAAILGQLRGVFWLMASLMYGTGLRLLECASLRIKDVDFHRNEITVRDGKGLKDRVTLLPTKLRDPLRTHIARVQRIHLADLRRARGSVTLPHALAKNSRGPNGSGHGSGCFRPVVSGASPRPAATTGTTFTSPRCSAPSKPPFARHE